VIARAVVPLSVWVRGANCICGNGNESKWCSTARASWRCRWCKEIYAMADRALYTPDWQLHSTANAVHLAPVMFARSPRG
jgi:hypothetical protein